jgi:hypothetical protein
MARIKYLLGTLWRGSGRRLEEATRLLSEAEDIKQQHLQFYRRFEVLEGPESRDLAIYDHMIPLEGGRSTIGRLRVSLADIPEVAKAVGG